jgi:small subunit ribosomal protein S8
MAVVDPISDVLARIRNAHLRLHADVNVPRSKMHAAIAGILQDEGYINGFEEQDREINIELKYANGKPLISGLKKISKPGRRVYVSAQDIPRVQNGIGICILSTSRGVLEGENARTAKVGGELLCEIW